MGSESVRVQQIDSYLLEAAKKCTGGCTGRGTRSLDVPQVKLSARQSYRIQVRHRYSAEIGKRDSTTTLRGGNGTGRIRKVKKVVTQRQGIQAASGASGHRAQAAKHKLGTRDTDITRIQRERIIATGIRQNTVRCSGYTPGTIKRDSRDALRNSAVGTE